MKTKNYFGKISVLCVVLMCLNFCLVSCSDDDNDNVVRPVMYDKHYTAENLNITFSGNKIVGKDVLFAPDENNIEKAILTFTGARFDIMGEITKSGEHNQFNYRTTSIFAGEPSFSLPIDMKIKGDIGYFEGSGESKYYTFNYSGNVLESELNIEFTDVIMKNNPLAGSKWKLQDFVPGESESDAITAAPIVNVWESEKKIKMLGIDMGQLLTLAFGMPLIDVENSKEKVSVYQIMGNLLKDVNFANDGGIAATYVDSKSKQTSVSSPTLAQYVMCDNNILRLVLNPFEIAKTARENNNGQKPDEETLSDISAFLPMILANIPAEDLLTDGIPLCYSLNDNKMTVYLNETMVLPMLKMITPMLQTPESVTAIVDQICEMMNIDTKNAMNTFYISMAKNVLYDLPGIIDSTTKIQLGLNFVKI